MTLSRPILDAIEAVVTANGKGPVPPSDVRTETTAYAQQMLDNGVPEQEIISQLNQMINTQ